MSFFAAYSVKVEEIPDSVAVIPLVAQLLPIAWVTDCYIELNELDEDFFNSIPNFKDGYVKMYPKINFGGKIIAGKLIKSNVIPESDKVGAFFSGGLDAFATLVAHATEKPMLITVRGSDIHTDNEKAWAIVTDQNRATAERFDCEFATVSSNFTEMLFQQRLNDLVSKVDENWWHGFQHGLGLLGLAAPLAYINRLKIVYIAASHTISDHVTCASDPSIDNYVRFCGCRVVHDQYECSRFEKTQNICRFVKKTGLKVFLRVCFRETEGHNCCVCEKCLRSAAAIAVLGYNPSDYGFDRAHIFRNSHMKVVRQISPSATPLWSEIRRAVIEDGYTLPKCLKWILTADLDRDHSSLPVRILNFACRKFHFLNTIFYKL